jgi:RNA polymerase sigma-70 factor, ECF subfamily
MNVVTQKQKFIEAFMVAWPADVQVESCRQSAFVTGVTLAELLYERLADGDPELAGIANDLSGDVAAHRICAGLEALAFDAKLKKCETRCGRDLLIAMCAEAGSAQALRLFRKDYLTPALGAARSFERSGVSREEIESTILSRFFLPTAGGEMPIAGYRGDGSLAAWLRVVVTRTGQDALRAATNAHTPTESDELESICNALPLPDVELAWIRQNHLATFKQCFHAAAAELEPDLADALRLHLTRSMSIDDLATLFQIHRATAARMLKRAHASLLELTRSKLVAALGLPEADCMSLIHAMLSQAELSIARALEREDLPSGRAGVA